MARPTEIKEIALLLESPADSAEALAREVIDKLDQLRSERTQWVLITQPVPGFTSAWGPFVSELKATKAWERYIKQVGDVLGSRSIVAPLRPAPPDFGTDESPNISRIVVSLSSGGARTEPKQLSSARPGGADVIYLDRIGGR